MPVDFWEAEIALMDTIETIIMDRNNMVNMMSNMLSIGKDMAHISLMPR